MNNKKALVSYSYHVTDKIVIANMFRKIEHFSFSKTSQGHITAATVTFKEVEVANELLVKRRK